MIRITASAICGTDLHFVRGTVGGMRKGTIDVYKRQALTSPSRAKPTSCRPVTPSPQLSGNCTRRRAKTVSYTHLTRLSSGKK